jgi:lipopolysaccharide/colanic/teichoic acid biosynthesis glycosyltransferase
VTSAVSPEPEALPAAPSIGHAPTAGAETATLVADDAIRSPLLVVPTDASSSVVIDISDGAHPAIVDLVDAESWVPDDVRGTGLLAAATWQRMVKRAIDISASVAMLAVLSPLLMVTALAVGLTSRGGVFFRQDRVGQQGRRFRMYKFRSMVRDAEALRARYEDRNHHTDGPIFKIPNDPRVTRVGRVIRRLSIDELPQLFNVIRGDMSLVGPRPPLPVEFDRYDQRELQRVLVRPGLTCIWQVSGRSEVDFDRWIDMDLEYIRHWDLRLDLRLLLKSVPAVISGRGAY